MYKVLQNPMKLFEQIPSKHYTLNLNHSRTLLDLYLDK